MNLKSIIALGIAGCAASAAQAVLFTGVGAGPGGAGAVARADFALAVDSIQTDDLESRVNTEGAPFDLTFVHGSGFATRLTGTGAISSVAAAGRHAFSGVNFWDGPVSSSFEITFGEAVSAFGFWGSDIGDFECASATCPGTTAPLHITLVLESGSPLEFDVTGSKTSGDDLFWGFADTSIRITKVTFTNLTGGADGQGFDDFMIGAANSRADPPPTVPEPGMLALVGLALVAAGVGRRRKG